MRHLLLAALAATAACKKKDDAEPASTATLRSAVAAELPGITFGVAGQVARADRRALIVWPAFEDGKPLDDDVVAFVLKRGDGGWTVAERNVALSSGSGAEALANALGGSDGHETERDCGVAQHDLAAHLTRHAKAFAKAREQQDAAAGVEAYEQMTRAFTWEHVAYSDMVPELLLLEAPRKWYCGAKGCTLEIEHGERRRAQTFALERCDGGHVLGEPLAPVQ